MRLLIWILVAGFFLLGSVTAQATKALWSLYWESNPYPCLGLAPNAPASMAGPLMSRYWANGQCNVSGVPVSICPDPLRQDPWDQAQLVTVVGYDVTCAVTSPSSQCLAEIGSAHSGDGADVFARTAGIGSNNKAGVFPGDTGIPQGAVASQHFDIYAACDGNATMQVLVHIFYTSP